MSDGEHERYVVRSPWVGRRLAVIEPQPELTALRLVGWEHVAFFVALVVGGAANVPFAGAYGWLLLVLLSLMVRGMWRRAGAAEPGSWEQSPEPEPEPDPSTPPSQARWSDRR